MGQKDMTSKMLESNNDVFADMLNGFLFSGNTVVNESELTPADKESHYKAEGKIRNQERDISKRWHKATIQIALFGYENQSDDDEFMALRVIGYDGADYRSQYKAKKTGENGTGKAYPVITLVIYFGNKDWKHGTNLHSCLEIPPELLPFVSDYKVNFFSIKDMTKEQIEKFHSDFKVIAEFFHALNNGEDYHPTDQKLNHPEEVIDMISVFSGDERFRDEYNSMTDENKEGGVTMCEIYDKIQQDGIAIGEARGILKTLVELVKDGILTLAEPAGRANMTVEEFESQSGLKA